jgi:hypothetical protein
MSGGAELQPLTRAPAASAYGRLGERLLASAAALKQGAAAWRGTPAARVMAAQADEIRDIATALKRRDAK